MTRTAPSAYLSTKADGLLAEFQGMPTAMVARLLRVRRPASLAYLVALICARTRTGEERAQFLKSLELRADNP